jgi:hypothetical protein
MDYAVKPLREHLVDLGKARIFYAVNGPTDSDVTPVHWDGGSELFLKELMLTNGEMTLEANAEYSDLKLTEYTGPIPIKRYYTGEAPVLQVNGYLSDPALRAIISPTGTKGAGFESQQPVQLLTLVAFPEMLFRGAVGQPLGTLSFSGGAWELNGSPIAAGLERYIGQILWIWSAAPDRAPLVFSHPNGGEALAQASFALVQDLELPFPEGTQVYWIGDPADASIDIEGGS